MSSKSVPEECQARVSSKSVLQDVKQEVSSKSVLKECQVRVSSKKGVLQECHLSVSRQGVPQVGSLENVISIVSVLQHTCRHSGSWASSCFFNYIPSAVIGCPFTNFLSSTANETWGFSEGRTTAVGKDDLCRFLHFVDVFCTGERKFKHFVAENRMCGNKCSYPSCFGTAYAHVPGVGRVGAGDACNHCHLCTLSEMKKRRNRLTDVVGTHAVTNRESDAPLDSLQNRTRPQFVEPQGAQTAASLGAKWGPEKFEPKE